MVNHSMRKLCPNLDKEDGLETVLEVPIPEEMFNKMGSNASLRWHNMRRLMRACPATAHSRASLLPVAASSNPDQFMLLLKLVCSPCIPFHHLLLDDHRPVPNPIEDASIESSTAKYIVQQYLAATGGSAAVKAVSSMYAVGQMKLVVVSDAAQNAENAMRTSEAGGFVLWQKNPDLWYLELVVSGHKITAGSNGRSAWSQSSMNLNPTRGPPKPLRRLFQGLDPRSISNLFSNTVCIGEKTINNDDCFILKLETSLDSLRAQSTPNTEIVYHTIWGYFSQRTGLMIQFEDSKLIQIKNANEDGAVFYETNLVSVLEDYRYVDGINIAHKGKTTASLLRYGKTLRRRWKLEETWKIEEVDFNIDGLSADYFLPPSGCKKESNEQDEQAI